MGRKNYTSNPDNLPVTAHCSVNPDLTTHYFSKESKHVFASVGRRSIMTTEEHVILSATVESSPFKNIDYIEMYVGNAHQAAHYYRTACGFTPTAWMGLET